MIEEAAVNIWLLQKQNTTYISHIYVKTVSIVSAHIRVNITSFAVFDRERDITLLQELVAVPFGRCFALSSYP